MTSFPHPGAPFSVAPTFLDIASPPWHDEGMEFIEPPPTAPGMKRAPADHHAIARELQSHPGRWAKAFVRGSEGSARQAAYCVRGGHAPLVAYGPKGAYEATWAQVDGEWWVWVRFVQP